MNTLLSIRSSLFSDSGHSSQLVGRFEARWRAAAPEGRVVVRDLAAEPVPHLTAERFQAMITPAAKRTGIQRELAKLSDRLVEELAAADEVVLGLPMYNFSIPSGLKAWFDHVARAGVTFRYTENGARGLLADRSVHVFATRGGRYAGTGADTQTALVRQFFAFLGISDLRFTYAEGLNLGDEHKRQSLKAAHQVIGHTGAISAHRQAA